MNLYNAKQCRYCQSKLSCLSSHGWPLSGWFVTLTILDQWSLYSRNDHDRIMLKMSKVTRQDLLWSWQAAIVSNINPKKKRVVDEPTRKTIGISKKWNQSKKWILNLSLTLISWGLAYYFIHYVGDEAPSLQSYIFPLTYEGYKSLRGDHYVLITRDLSRLLNTQYPPVSPQSVRSNVVMWRISRQNIFANNIRK